MATIVYDLDTFFKTIGVNRTKLVRQIAFEFLDGVIRLSPVDTGFFRSQWKLRLRGQGKKTRATIVNTAVYASFLEEGISNQAPNGMIRPVESILIRKYQGAGNNVKFQAADRAKQFLKPGQNPRVRNISRLRSVKLNGQPLNQVPARTFLKAQQLGVDNLLVLLSNTVTNVKPKTMLAFLKVAMFKLSNAKAVVALEALLLKGLTDAQLKAETVKLFKDSI